LSLDAEHDPNDPLSEYAETPIAPGEVASAARSCSVVLLLLMAIGLIVCAVVAVSVL
jgi:hypothetical protein